jgi:hypothetical protein
MAVGPARAETCLGCHAHQASEHMAPGRDCRTCHVPLAQATALSAARVQALPRPASHGAADFLLSHAPASATEVASCATCHAVESCTRCHLNAPALPAIAGLGSDARVADIVKSKPPQYPRPPTHAAPDWTAVHGTAALANAARCANCHEQSGCRNCHQQSPPPVIATLPRVAETDPRGVRLATTRSAVHDRNFRTMHASEAATGTCSNCHRETFCESCHDAARNVFHKPNFIERHGPEVYGSSLECSSCHNTEVFCRSCHTRAGLGGGERLGVAFHTSNPFWLVGHGEAARRGLEGCASCHAQTSCTRCHSALTGWRVNPHPPGFRSGTIGRANPVTCRLCHASVPR